MGNVSFLRTFLLRAEVEKLHVTCRYLQRSAIIEHKQEIIILDEAHNSYCSSLGTQKLSSGIRFGFLGDLKGPPSSGANNVSKSITFANNQIIFYPNGIIQAGTIYFVDNFCDKSCALTSSIASVSHLRKYYYYQKKWQRI